MTFEKTGFRTGIGIGGASSTGRRRVIGALRGWIRSERGLEVAVGGVWRRAELCLGTCNLGKECATHFDFDFWYTALWKVRGGYLPDPAYNGLCMAFDKTGFRTVIGVGGASAARQWRDVGEIRG